mgnify:CR=1 FL=1
MSIEQAKTYLARFGREKDVLEFPVSSATVDLAAQALSVIPARITKTIAFDGPEGPILIGMAGDAKVDNKKYKAYFGKKAKMLSPEETLSATGHAIGGVCSFGVPEQVKSYLDISLQRFSTVFPACGSSNSAIELTCDDLFSLSNALAWIDVCKGWQEDPEAH